MKYDLETFKMNVRVFFENLGYDYQATQRHMPQEGKFAATPL
jgi:hypothetical protein